MQIDEDEIDKLRIQELQQLLEGVRVSLTQGSSWLISRMAPSGPICGVESVEYCHKSLWGLYSTGVDKRILARILDWLSDKALRENFDFYFEGEPRTYKDLQRVYRPLTFLKVAAWIDHPLHRREEVIDRVLMYQHSSGGVFNYIGEDPENVEERESIGPLETSFFGHLMIALENKERAIKAGDWLTRFVKANEPYMKEKNVMYCAMKVGGGLVLDVDPDDPNGLINTVDKAQPTWQTGTIMAYLAVLYEVMRERWNLPDSDASRYLDAAYSLLDFEDKMPFYTYQWPSKCKVAWGAGELLRVILKFNKGDESCREKAYKAAKNTVVITFIDNQLPSGGWPNEHYPLSKSIPEYYYNYKPIRGVSIIPDKPTENADVKTIYLPAEEITGEFLGEMKAAETGFKAYWDYYWNRMRGR